MEPLISVVIPVYNVEKYLARCVESVINQTYRNLEIILVDDGSPDKCPQLCDGYARKDRRIKVIHKKNGGLSDARNAGTMCASGDYITYVDSDDWIAASMIGRLTDQTLMHKAEIAICQCQKTNGTKVEPVLSRKVVPMDGLQAMTQMLYQREIDNSACAKLYSIELARKYRYPVGKLYEDLFTTYKLLYSAQKVVVILEPHYYYFMNANSIMHQEFNIRMFDELEAVNEIEQFVRSHCPEALPAAYARKFSAYCQVLRWIPAEKQSNEIEEQRQKIWCYLREYRWRMMADPRARLKNRVAAGCTLLGERLFAKIRT